MPFAFMMGVDWKDARIVGQLLGTKTVVNEFIAYQQFGKYVSSKSNVNTTTMSVSTTSFPEPRYGLSFNLSLNDGQWSPKTEKS